MGQWESKLVLRSYSYVCLQHFLLQGIFSNEADRIILNLIQTDFPERAALTSRQLKLQKYLLFGKGICCVAVIIRNVIKRSLTKSFKELSKVVLLCIKQSTFIN